MNIEVTTILDRGATYLSNHPDHLAKRTALALLLVDARIVKSLQAGIALLKIWAQPQARQHPIEVLINLANEKAADK